MNRLTFAALAFVLCVGCAGAPEATGEPSADAVAESSEATECGPQTPRDISSKAGENRLPVPTGPTPTLCNVHFHEPFEHAGFAGGPTVGEASGAPVCGSVDVGAQIEFHWVYTSCPEPEQPVDGLANCLCDRDDTVLRVFAQSYLVGDSGGPPTQPAGELVRFPGSTTGPSYDNETCSLLRVNWEVSPTTGIVDKAALREWCETHPWGDDDRRPHGVRELVTRLDWLAPIP